MVDGTAFRFKGRSAAVAMMRTIALLALGCGLAGLAAPVAQATASWAAPQAVFSTPVSSIQADPFFNRKALDVATDSAGNSIAVWIEAHPKVPGPGTECQAMEAMRPAGGSFGAPQGLGPAMTFCAGQIKLAMNASGTAVVAWKQGAEIDAAIKQPGGSFSAPVRLDSSTSTDDPWVSINDSGVAAITWDDTAVGTCSGLTSGINWALHAVIFHPGVGFGGVETVCDAYAAFGGPTIFTPRSAVDPQGDVVATWVNKTNTDGVNSHNAVEWAYRPAGGSFNGAAPHAFADSLNPISPSGSFAADVGFDAQGRATAVWPHFNGTHTLIETAVRPPGDSTLFTGGGAISDSTADSNSPRVAVDPGTNTAVAAWVQCSAGSCQVEGSARPSGGGFQTPQPLSGPGATTDFGPLVHFYPGGDAIAIWSGPSPDVAGTQVQVAGRPAGIGQSFGAVSTISTDDPSKSPAIAFDGKGNAIAIWEHDTTSPAGAVLQYADFKGSSPEVGSVSFHVAFHAKRARKGRARFTKIVVTKLTHGAKVQMRCLGKHKGCPFKVKKVKRTGRKANLAKLLRGHVLNPGAVVEIRATMAGSVGRVADLVVRRGTAKLRTLCLPPGKVKPQKRC